MSSDPLLHHRHHWSTAMHDRDPAAVPPPLTHITDYTTLLHLSGPNPTTGDIATLSLASARRILRHGVSLSVLKTTANGHLTDAECRAFLDSAPEDWPAKPLHGAGSTTCGGYCIVTVDSTRWTLHRVAAAYWALTKAKNRDS